MATKYWFKVATKSINAVLKDIGLKTSSTLGASVIDDEVLSIEFASALSADDETSLKRNLRSAGYKYERTETI